MTFWKILTGIATGLFLFCLALYFISGCNHKKQIAGLILERDACRNAPATIDTVRDTIYVQGGTIIRPIPFKVIIHDSIFVVLKESFYDSVYRGSGWRFRYRLKTLGELDHIIFSDFVAPREIITITKKVDTCESKLPEYRPLNHYGISSGLCINNFNKFPGIKLEGFWSIQDRVAIRIGTMFLPNANEKWYGTIGIDVYLDMKKRK